MPHQIPPPPDVAPDELIVAIVELAWDDFEAFLRDPILRRRMGDRTVALHEHLLALIEAHPEETKAVFAAGVAAGIDGLQRLLQQAHEIHHQTEQMRQRPARTIPRA